MRKLPESCVRSWGTSWGTICPLGPQRRRRRLRATVVAVTTARNILWFTCSGYGSAARSSAEQETVVLSEAVWRQEDEEVAARPASRRPAITFRAQ